MADRGTAGFFLLDWVAASEAGGGELADQDLCRRGAKPSHTVWTERRSFGMVLLSNVNDLRLLRMAEGCQDPLRNPDSTEVGVWDDENPLRLFGKLGDQLQAGIGGRPGGVGDGGIQKLVTGCLGRLEVFDDEQDGGVGDCLHVSALIGPELDRAVEKAKVQLLSGAGTEDHGSPETEAWAASQSERQDGCLASAGIEEDGRCVVVGLGIGKVGLAEGAWPVMTHPFSEVVCGVDEDAQSRLVAT